MSRKSESFCIESKLKHNQKLSCSGCHLIFESIISAAEHTIYCKKKGMEGRQKKRKLDLQPQIKFQKTDATSITSGRVIVFLHWSQRNVALLLKCIHNRVNLFTPNDSNDSVWQEIEIEMKKQFSWVVTSACQTKWKKLKEETEEYFSNEGNKTSHHSTAKPDFFYIVREINRRMSEIKNDKYTVKLEEEEDEDSANEEDLLADPDVVEEEPFAGVMDSQGNLHMREFLLEVVRSMEVNESCSDAVLGKRHGVEQAVVEWVRENRESIIKGSLQCSTCKRRMLKRKNYIKHELDCIFSTEGTGSVEDNGGYIFTYNREKDDDSWSSARTSALIDVFKERASSFVSPEGTLRKGIWLEIYNKLKPKHPELTPQACCDKWTSLVREAREYTVFSQKKAEDKTVNGVRMLTFRPAFFDEIASIVDLSSVDEDSPSSFIPKELIPGVKGRSGVSFARGGGDYRENREDDNNSEDGPDDAIAASNDSFEETLSVGESSEGEADEEEGGRAGKKDVWGMKTRLGDVEQKVRAMENRLKELEEENRTLRQGSAVEGHDQVSHLVSRLEQFLHTQNRLQTTQMEALTKMIAMLERQHRENLTAMKALVQEVSKKHDVREKNSK